MAPLHADTLAWSLGLSRLSWILAPLVGATAGLHAATWGTFKDALYEGFSARKYARSVVAGALASLVIEAGCGFDLATAAGFILLFATSYALERGTLEAWKAFVREEDQDKYFIPMQFAVFGRVVRSKLARRAAGAGYVAALALLIIGLVMLQPAGGHPALWSLLVVGTFGGWVSAFGGAWKDAPKEGFQLFKFFRSPGIALGFALLLTRLTDSYLVVAFGALGLTIATIETHKKFGDAMDAPGKFSGKPVTHPEMYRQRRRLVPVYAAIWGLVAAMFASSLVTSSPAAVALMQAAR